jgi:glycosyltransferase involved in cell wall biosynthesis
MLNDSRVARHAETLGFNGFEVTVICPSSNRARQDEIRPGYEIHRSKNFILGKLADLDERWRKLSDNSQGRKDKTWIKLAALSLLQVLLTQLTLFRTARSQRAQIYCANDLDTLLGAILAAGLDRKVAYDSHELWPDMMLMPTSIKTLARAVEKLLVRRTDLVMTVNEFIAEELVSRYSLRNRPQVVYNCPGTDFHVMRKKEHRDLKIALYQGRYSPDRALENLVRAADHLLPDIRLVLRGFGILEQKLRSLSVGRTNIQFEHPVNVSELISVASEADVGIITYPPTNLNNYLASPNKLFEYILAGLPVVASNIPFLRKVIVENDIGALFDARDPKSIADAINQSTRECVLNRQRANLVSVAAKYTWNVESKKLLQAYASLR